MQGFEFSKRSLAHQVNLANREDRRRLCVFTDASDFVGSDIVNQIPSTDVQKAHAEQSHEALTFLSGSLMPYHLAGVS